VQPDAARRAVDGALVEHGLLLVQGQAEVPSIADLLAGEPVTTRGYSWDYVPAKTLAFELSARDDVGVCKLLRGRTTLVHRRLWPAVHGLAVAARANVHSALLDVIDARPGVSGEECRAVLAIDSRAFQRDKTNLERWLCVWSDERDDVDFHTHDRAWFPWSTGKIARGTNDALPADVAATVLLDALASDAKPATLFPVLKPVRLIDR
jgi:hypothetical protein